MKQKMIKVMLLLVVLLGFGSAAFAAEIKVTTSCGKTVTLESSDYKTAQEVVNASVAVDKALCP